MAPRGLVAVGLKVWCDVLTPKQARFCRALAREFERAGHEVAFTTRAYPEAEGMLELLGVEAAVVGRHGGANRFDKLVASAERVAELARHVRGLKPDLAFSFASPEGARVAFGLGVPYFTANDSPHSRFVAQLTIPLAEVLFTPWFIRTSWRRLGVPKSKIVPYRALDPLAWLEGFVPNRAAVEELGLSPDEDYVVIRPEEAQASYLEGKADEHHPVTVPVIERILEEFPVLPVVVLCRYPVQREAMRRRFGGRIILPERVVDGVSLLAFSTLLVGAGGTMNQEACLLGVPVISCYPGEELDIERFLSQRGLLYRLTDSKEAAGKAVEILSHRRRYQELHLRRASRLRSGMENPARFIANWIHGRYQR